MYCGKPFPENKSALHFENTRSCGPAPAPLVSLLLPRGLPPHTALNSVYRWQDCLSRDTQVPILLTICSLLTR